MERTISESLGYKDTLEIEHIRGGKVLFSKNYDLIVNKGKEVMAKRIYGNTPAGFTYVAIGTGTTAPAATDTALQAEITTGGGARKTGTCTFIAPATAQIEATFDFTTSFTVTESGLFNASSAGDMLCRQTFGPYSVVSGDSLILRWKISVS